MKNIINIIFLAFLYSSAFAQLDDTLKAKLYFNEAQELFAKGDFNGSLSYVEKAENTLGKKVASTMAMKIKIAYNLSNFSQAKDLFDDYTNNYMKGAPKELNDEILAMFIDIEEAVEAERTRLFIKINGRKLEIAKEDLGEMTWQEAKDACNRLGAGWRLPTKDELEQMYLQLHKNGKGNFKLNYYWSSTEDDYYFAWYFYFYNGVANFKNKYNTSYVRAVRAL
jgi:hypothetical protein